MDKDRYPGANCGDSTGAVLGQVVRGLRVLAHRQGRRCASDQQTWLLLDLFIDSGIQFGRANAVFFMSSSPHDDDDEGSGDDNDFLECGAAKHALRPWKEVPMFFGALESSTPR